MNLLLGCLNGVQRVRPDTQRTSAVTIDLAANTKSWRSNPLRTVTTHFSEQVVTAVRVEFQPEYADLAGRHPPALGKRRRCLFG